MGLFFTMALYLEEIKKTEQKTLYTKWCIRNSTLWDTTAYRLTTIAHKEKPLVLGQTKRTKYKIRTNYTL